MRYDIVFAMKSGKTHSAEIKSGTKERIERQAKNNSSPVSWWEQLGDQYVNMNNVETFHFVTYE